VPTRALVFQRARRCARPIVLQLRQPQHDGGAHQYNWWCSHIDQLHGAAEQHGCGCDHSAGDRRARAGHEQHPVAGDGITLTTNPGAATLTDGSSTNMNANGDATFSEVSLRHTRSADIEGEPGFLEGALAAGPFVLVASVNDTEGLRARTELRVRRRPLSLDSAWYPVGLQPAQGDASHECF